MQGLRMEGSAFHWNISSVVRQVELWQAVSLLSLVNVAC